jgi:diguanylate cyclase (GGDEF)-like protein
VKRTPVLLVPAVATAVAVVMAVKPGSTVAEVAYLVCFAAMVVLAWVRIRRLTGPVRTGCAFLVGALTVWVSGDLLYDLLTWVLGPLDDPTPSDVLWIGGYPLVAIGLVKLLRLRAPGRLREGILDALAMATVMAWLCWQFVILPQALAEKLSLGTVVASFYPFGDVVLFAVIAMLVLAPGSKRGSTGFLAAALAATLIGDVAISILPQLFENLSRAMQAERLDGLLLVANSFFVAAVVHPQAARLGDPDDLRDQRLHPARVVFLGIALVTLPTFAGLEKFESTISRVSLLASIGVLTSVILVRFVLVVRQQEYIRAILAHQTRHDQLTGLANRQALQDGLELALSRARHKSHAYGPVVFYLDLNGFKQINDRYGHAAGDFVLVEFARRLRAGMRLGDLPARLGGDEFVVMSEDVRDEAEARALAERLRALGGEPVCRSEETFPIGVSVGMAAAGDFDRPEADAMLAAADATMYADKISRRTPLLESQGSTQR